MPKVKRLKAKCLQEQENQRAKMDSETERMLSMSEGHEH